METEREHNTICGPGSGSSSESREGESEREGVCVLKISEVLGRVRTAVVQLLTQIPPPCLFGRPQL